MIVLDGSIVNLAIPSAAADLAIAPADVQWIVTAYTLTFGGFLLLGGRIADYWGRKRTFLVGLVGFAVASLIGGLAPTAGFLIAARALQGGFAAMLAPAALALITVSFHDPKERAKAFGVIGAISGAGAAVGLLLGGVLTEYLSWRWCLTVNTPIAIATMLFARALVKESRAGGNTSYDIPGAITATLGLVALVYGFTQAAPNGYQDSAHWTDPSTLVWFVAAAVLLGSFLVIEARTANPLLPLRIVRERNRGGAYLSSLITGAGLFAMFLFLGLYLQVIKEYTPVQAGFAFLPVQRRHHPRRRDRGQPHAEGRTPSADGTRARRGRGRHVPADQAHADVGLRDRDPPPDDHHERGHGVRVHPHGGRRPARRRQPRRRRRLGGDEHHAAGRRLAGNRADEHRRRHRDVGVPRGQRRPG